MTKIKEIFKNIGRTKSNFFSIILFVTFGIGLFQSFDYTSTSILNSMDMAFKNTNGYDFEIPYPLGITKEEMEQFKSVEKVSRVEGSFTGYEFTTLNNELHACTINSLTNEINQSILSEGRLPEKDNEIVLLKSGAQRLGLHVGDKLTFKDGNGPTNYIISQLRNIDLIENIDDILNNSFKNLLYDEFEIVGFIAHPTNYAYTISGYGTYPDSAIQVEIVAYVNYSAFNPVITNNYFTKVYVQSDYLNNFTCYSEEYKNEVNEIIKKIKPIAEIFLKDSTIVKIQQNVEKILENEDIINELARILKDSGYISEQTYQDYYKIKEEIKKYSKKITRATSVSAIARYDNFLFSYGLLTNNVISNCKYALGGVFFFIAILICFSSLNRLVADDMKLIGTKKALGFKKGEIYFGYLGYTLIASLIGIILGNILTLIFEYLLIPLSTTTFDIPVLFTYIKPLTIISIALMVAICLELITLVACKSLVKRKTVALLQGDTGTENRKIRFYEKTNLWEKIPLVNKTIINNTINDKKRCIGTILGIAASTCLIVGSIMMNRNVIECIKKENSQHFKFNSLVFFDPNNENSYSDLLSYFEENNIKATPLYRELVFVDVGRKEKAATYLMVYKNIPSFNDVFGIESSSDFEFNYEGMWINESVKHGFQLQENDATPITTLTGDEAQMQITGFYKTYTYFISAFISEDYYEKAFGEPPVFNTFAVNLRDSDVTMIKSDLSKIGGYKLTFDYESFIKETIDSFLIVANAVVGMYVVICLMTGFFVILNLLVAFVTEKKRELITLMVNGYTYKKACQYIYADTIFLTILGLIVGVFAGILLGNVIIFCFESGYIHLSHTPNITAIIIGCGTTILITTLMTLISLRKIKTYKLNDLNTALL